MRACAPAQWHNAFISMPKLHPKPYTLNSKLHTLNPTKHLQCVRVLLMVTHRYECVVSHSYLCLNWTQHPEPQTFAWRACAAAHWRDSFVCMWYDSFKCTSIQGFLISRNGHFQEKKSLYKAERKGCPRQDPFKCVAWFIYVRETIHLHACHDSFIRTTWIFHVCDMTHTHVPHDLVYINACIITGVISTHICVCIYIYSYYTCLYIANVS